MIVQAAAEGDVACPVWQRLAESSNECYEVRFVVALKMRQVATIEGHGRNYSVIKDGEAITEARQNLQAFPKQERVAADALVRLRAKLVLSGKAETGEEPRTNASGAT